MTFFAKNFRAFGMAGLASVALAACASTDTGPLTPGQRMAERGGEIAEYGADWSAGQSSVREGERLVERSEKRERDARKDLSNAEDRAARAQRDLQQAQADLARGQQMIQQGTQQMERAEANYEDIRSRAPAIGAQEE